MHIMRAVYHHPRATNGVPSFDIFDVTWRVNYFKTQTVLDMLLLLSGGGNYTYLFGFIT